MLHTRRAGAMSRLSAGADYAINFESREKDQKGDREWNGGWLMRVKFAGRRCDARRNAGAVKTLPAARLQLVIVVSTLSLPCATLTSKLRSMYPRIALHTAHATEQYCVFLSWPAILPEPHTQGPPPRPCQAASDSFTA